MNVKIGKVTLTCNLGKRHEIQGLEERVSMAKFSLVTTEPCKDKVGNAQTEAERFALAAAWPSSTAERFIVLDKLDGAATDKAEINANF